MINTLNNLKYTKNHEWAKYNDNVITIGITDYAQKQLGDIVYIELPEINTIIKKNSIFGVIESVKSVSDLISPISGEIISINKKLINSPEKINIDPYHDGWMIKIKINNLFDFKLLINTKEYHEFLSKIIK